MNHIVILVAVFLVAIYYALGGLFRHLQNRLFRQRLEKLIIGVLIVALLVRSIELMNLFAAAAPGAVTEEYDHNHERGFTLWADTKKLPASPGSYYLTEDVSLSDDWIAPDGETRICLNGHKIENSKGYVCKLFVENSSSLIIDDCTDKGEIAGWLVVYDDGKLTVNNGYIHDAETHPAKQYAVCVDERGTVIINGGTIGGSEEFCGIRVTDIILNGSVLDEAECNVIINGGKILGRSGILNYAEKGTLTVSAGEITGSEYAGVDNIGTLKVHGGIITGSDDGWGIDSNGRLEITKGTVCGGIYNGGDMEMTGGDLRVPTSGGNVIYNDGTLKISEGSISGNVNYPAIYNCEGTVEVTGGNISSEGNTGIYNLNKLDISGGSISAVGSNGYGIKNDGGTTTVEDGDISGIYRGIYNFNNGKVTIAGGSISSLQYAVSNQAAVYIESGNISSDGSSAINNQKTGMVEITGGDITGSVYGIVNSGIFKLSGSPSFAGSTADIHLNEGAYISITGALSEDKVYRVHMTSPGEFTDSTDTGYNNSANFASAAVHEENGLGVSQNEANGQLTLMPAYVITYAPGEHGKGTIARGVKIIGKKFTISSETFIRTGYTQTGWAKTDGGTKVYELGDTYTEDADITLYPYWEDLTAPVIGKPVCGYQPKHLWNWLIGRESLMLTVPVTEEGSGADNITYVITPAGGQSETKSVAIENGTAIITVNVGFKGSIVITCTDRTGNISDEITVGGDGNGILIEDSAPVINLETEGGDTSAEGYYETAPEIKVVVTDDKDNVITSGIASVTYRIGSGEEKAVGKDKYTADMVTSDSFTIPADEIPDGKTVITVIAIDHAGNRTEESITVQVKEVPEETPKTESGNIDTEARSGENAPDISFPADMDIEALADAVLSEEEKLAVQNGANIKIFLTVEDAGATVSDEDKQKADAKVREYGYIIGQYLDVEMIKIIDDSDRIKIASTEKPVRIVITIPDSLKGNGNRTFAIVRIHDGEAVILEDLDKSPDTITIETDLFSTYVLVYNETQSLGSDVTDKGDTAATGDTAYPGACATLILLAGGSLIVLHLKKRKTMI